MSPINKQKIMYVNTPFYKALLLVVALLIGACAQQPRITPPASLIAHQQQLQAINNWQLSGKLGLRAPSQSGSTSIKWSQEAQNYEIDLSGPLGQGRMQIHGNPNKVTLEQAGKPPLSARNAEALIKKASGWTLPVQQLAFWVRGAPDPQLNITQLTQNNLGLAESFEQGGWTISYSNYKDQPLGLGSLPLPSKIIAEHHDIRLTLIIRNWQLGEGTH